MLSVRHMRSRVASATRARAATTVAGTWIEGQKGMDTLCVHSGVKPEEETGAILTPVYLSTTFVQESVENYQRKGFSYSRTHNPTVTVLEKKVAELENGYGAALFGTGMAATTTVMTGFLQKGDHCVITQCSYGGTNRICREHFGPNLGMEFSFVDFADLDAVRAAIRPNTKMLFSETPSNPTLSLVDLDAVSQIAKENNLLHVCDTTFATPIMVRPMDHGADLTVQSTTKFYDGHNITNGGAVISRTAELHERVKHVQNMHGNIMSPMVAFLQLQTCKTMPIRLRQQSASAMKLAQFLETHPKVTKVVYPGLDSFPQKELADRYHRNGIHGSMLWFDVAGGSASGKSIMNSIQRPWSLCENLGSTESIITACAIFTHANMLPEDREKVGITDGFIRVSVGLEDADDLIKALKISLDQL